MSTDDYAQMQAGFSYMMRCNVLALGKPVLLMPVSWPLSQVVVQSVTFEAQRGIIYGNCMPSAKTIFEEHPS